jgi:hypothetical protein
MTIQFGWESSRGVIFSRRFELQQHVLFFMIGNVESLTMSFRYPTVYHRLYLVRYLNGQYYERGRYQEDPLYQITKLLLLATEMNR